MTRQLLILDIDSGTEVADLRALSLVLTSLGLALVGMTIVDIGRLAR